MNPYLILGVPFGANDRQVREAYLRAIKEASPDTHPERFKVISKAYEQIKDEAHRLRYYLFDRTAPAAGSPIEALAEFLRVRPPSKPVGFEEMKEYLRACSKI